MIATRTEDLLSTNYKDRYSEEILRKSASNPRNLKKKELEWLIFEHPEWTAFTITVVFKNLVPVVSNLGMEHAAHYEFQKGILTKIKRRLCRSQKHWEKVLPHPDFCVYEYEQGSFFKKLSESRLCHHIHGIFLVPERLDTKIYNFKDLCLDERLDKDINSMKSVSSFHIDPLRHEDAFSWHNYMMKSKGLDSIVGES